MALHNERGKKGEELAKQFLEAKGYEILDQNWAYKHAEIDLIAFHNQTLIFVEVKTRSSLHFGEPQDFVSPRKHRLLASAASRYIELIGYSGEIRFDIIGIYIKDEHPKINHIENAFWPV